MYEGDIWMGPSLLGYIFPGTEYCDINITVTDKASNYMVTGLVFSNCQETVKCHQLSFFLLCPIV